MDVRSLGRRRRVLLVLLWAAWIACTVALVLILVDVETVVATGPCIFLLGAALTVTAAWDDNRAAAALGAAHCLLCVLFFLLVNVRSWSPDEARVPFLVMGIVHLLGVSVATVWILGRLAPPHVPGQCDRCGYLLFGLQDAREPRCPECGKPFDPRELASPAPSPVAAMARL